MIRHGTAPFLECSSKGDSRFSAFSARIRARGNRSIEELYQAAKVFEDGSTGLSWRAAKGRAAVNMADVSALYSRLWDEYILENPTLKAILAASSGLSDCFGQAGHCCQATELWRIKNGLHYTESVGEPAIVRQSARPAKILSARFHPSRNDLRMK